MLPVFRDTEILHDEIFESERSVEGDVYLVHRDTVRRRVAKDTLRLPSIKTRIEDSFRVVASDSLRPEFFIFLYSFIIHSPVDFEC